MAALKRGRRAEDLAIFWLRLKGYNILARNHRSGAGEIDIIARKGRIVAFIEVKARRDPAIALEAIARQRPRLLRGAAAFLARRPDLALLSPRFDAMVVAHGRWPHHIIDAWRELD